MVEDIFTDSLEELSFESPFLEPEEEDDDEEFPVDIESEEEDPDDVLADSFDDRVDF